MHRLHSHGSHEQCFRQIFGQICVFFLDDFLIYSKNEEEHEKHLRMVLKVLRELKLYAKLIKCDFCQRQIHFFGSHYFK